MVFIRLWLPVLFCLVLIFYASSVPGSDIPPVFTFQDIVFHFSAYFILGFLFSRALLNMRKGAPVVGAVFLTVIFGTFYAITDEFHQYFVPLRQPSIFDVFIDSLGVITGAGVYAFLRTRLLKGVPR